MDMRHGYDEWIVWLWDAFSQRVEKGSLAEVDNTTTTLLYATLNSSNVARPLKMLKMLVFDRTRLSPLFWHSAVQSTYTAFL